MARPTAFSNQKSRHRKKSKKNALASATLLLFLSFLSIGIFCQSARADSSPAPDIPAPGSEFYYLDQANILSGNTRGVILEKNQELYSSYGVQIVVMTMNSIPTGSYSQRVLYLRSVMDSWQIGGEDGRGLLLAVSVDDMDYIALCGDAMKSQFATDSLKALLDAQLEPDFSAGLYDVGIQKFFSAVAEKAAGYCADNPDAFGPVKSAATPVGSKPAKKSLSPLAIGFIAAGIFLVLSLSLYLISMRASRGSRRGRSSRRLSGGSYRIHRHNPVITPPRTTVLRHESRPAIHIKTSGSYRGQKSSHNRNNIDWRQ